MVTLHHNEEVSPVGEEYTYTCRKCGKSMPLTICVYECKGWGDRESLAAIKDGKYGRKPKSILETVPGTEFHFQSDVFSCECGYTKSYDSLVIHSRDVLEPVTYFFSEHRCPRCRKAMSRMSDFPTDFMCPKCGDRMWMDTRSLFRW